jgi:phospholipase C
MLPSPRTASAPNLAHLLTQTSAQAWPDLPSSIVDLSAIPEPPYDEPLNGVQKGILIGAAGLALGRPFTAAETLVALAKLQTHGDGRAWAATFVEKLPMK